LSPLVSYPVGVLTVDVERTLAGRFVAFCFGEVDREVSLPVREGIGVVME
jgi:hypothetical protein